MAEKKQSTQKGKSRGPQEILRLYTKIAFADIREFTEFGTDEEGLPYIRLRPDTEVDGELIEEIVISAGKVPRIKLFDKFKALEKLERHYDLLPDQWKREMDKAKMERAGRDKQETQMNIFTQVPRPEGQQDGHSD